MRLCRFDDERLGYVTGTTVHDVTAALDVLPPCRYPLPPYDLLMAHFAQVRARVCELSRSGVPSMPLESVRLLSPIANPGKIVAAPVNYQKHLDEVALDPQLHQDKKDHTFTIHSAALFLKATSSLVGPGQGVEARHPDRRTDHEVELVAVIGRTASQVSRQDALACVAGYAIGLDMTIRGTEDRSFRKSLDTFSVLGPWFVTADEVGDAGCLDLTLAVNDDVRQHANTRQMILDVPALIELASKYYTLNPGDLIFTGTPEGVGPVRPGDRITATVDRIGTMTVDVRG